MTHTLTAEGFDASEDGTGRGQPIVPHPIAFTAKDHGQDATEDLSPTLRSGGHTDSHANGGVMPAVAYAIQERAICENPNAGPDGVGVRGDDCAYTLEARSVPQAVAFVQNSRSEVRLMAGDGSVTGALAAEPGAQQQTYVAYNETPWDCQEKRIIDVRRGVAPTISARSNGGGTVDGWYAMPDMAVRRLLPVETERLQGFPRNWTRIPVRFYRERTITKTRPEDMWEPGDGGWWLMAADGPRYKQCGNSMAANVMRWIGGRIKDWLELEPFRELIG